MKNNSLVIMLTALVMIGAMSACTKKSVPSDSPPEIKNSPTVGKESTLFPSEEPVEPEKQSPPSESKPPVAAVSGTLSDDLYSFQVQVNGVTYSLPALYSEFEANGWIGKDFDTSTIKPKNKTLSDRVSNGEQIVYLAIVNLAGDVLTYDKCYVGKVSLSTSDAKKGATLVLPKGITLGSTMDEVTAAYGEPSDLRESAVKKTLTYSAEIYSSVKIIIDSETNLVDQIEVENLISKQPAVLPSVNGDVPKVVTDYKSPSDLGSDWNSFNVKYAGAIYHIPAPVAAFVANGWRLLDTDVVVDAQSSKVGVSLQKDNQTLRTTVKNYADTAQPVSNCFVTIVMYDKNSTKLSIELAEGITEGSTIEELIAAYGEPKDKDTSASTYDYYSYGKVFEEVEIYVSKETGKISKIVVNNSPKNLD